MAFELLSKLGLDWSGFKVGLKQAESASGAFAKHISSEIGGQVKSAFAGYIGFEAIKELGHQTIEYAHNIETMSERLGVSTDRLQEFDFAAKKSGASLEDFAHAMQKIGVTRSKALDEGPAGGMVKAFQKLGVSFEDLKSKRIDDLFLQIGDAFQKSKDPQQLLAASIEVMGRNSASVFAAMMQGLRGTSDEARRLGTVIDEDVIDKLGELNVKMEVSGMRARSTFAKYFVPLFEHLGRGFNQLHEFSFGTAASLAGALSAGASFSEARKIQKDITQEFVNNELGDDQAAAALAKKRKKAAEALAGSTFSALNPQVQSGGGLHFASDSLAKIGGFGIGADRSAELMKELVAVQQDARTSLTSIDMNTNPSVLGL